MTVVGDAVSVLVGASRRATLLVVGTRQGGTWSVGVVPGCVRHAACPVVVIPPGARV